MDLDLVLCGTPQGARPSRLLPFLPLPVAPLGWAGRPLLACVGRFPPSFRGGRSRRRGGALAARGQVHTVTRLVTVGADPGPRGASVRPLLQRRRHCVQPAPKDSEAAPLSMTEYPQAFSAGGLSPLVYLETTFQRDLVPWRVQHGARWTAAPLASGTQDSPAPTGVTCQQPPPGRTWTPRPDGSHPHGTGISRREHWLASSLERIPWGSGALSRWVPKARGRLKGGAEPTAPIWAPGWAQGCLVTSPRGGMEGSMEEGASQAAGF